MRIDFCATIAVLGHRSERVTVRGVDVSTDRTHAVACSYLSRKPESLTCKPTVMFEHDALGDRPSRRDGSPTLGHCVEDACKPDRRDRFGWLLRTNSLFRNNFGFGSTPTGISVPT